MTDEELQRFKKFVKDYTEKVCQSPETARLALVSNGIYRLDGILHEQCGGPTMTDEEKEQFRLDQEMANARIDELLR